MQVSELMQTLCPASLAQIRAYLMQYTWGKYLVERAPQARERARGGGAVHPGDGLSFPGVAGFLEATIVIPGRGDLRARRSRDLYRSGLLHLVPPAAAPSGGGDARRAVVFNLRHWLVGQVTLMVILGITTAAGLRLIGMPAGPDPGYHGRHPGAGAVHRRLALSAVPAPV